MPLPRPNYLISFGTVNYVLTESARLITWCLEKFLETPTTDSEQRLELTNVINMLRLTSAILNRQETEARLFHDGDDVIGDFQVPENANLAGLAIIAEIRSQMEK